MKKFGKFASHFLISNNAIHSLPTVQISLGIVAFFKKIYDGEPILRVFSVIGDNTVVSFNVLCENCNPA
jgi:hypothetical protein